MSEAEIYAGALQAGLSPQLLQRPSGVGHPRGWESSPAPQQSQLGFQGCDATVWLAPGRGIAGFSPQSLMESMALVQTDRKPTSTSA